MTTRDECYAVYNGVPRQEYVTYAIAQACRVAINSDIFIRQIDVESGFQPCVGSYAGAQGIAQIVPWYHPGVDTWNPYASLEYAADLDRSNLNQYGSYKLMLAAYNAGGGAIAAYGADVSTWPSPGYDQTRLYLTLILGQGWPEPGPGPVCGPPPPACAPGFYWDSVQCVPEVVLPPFGGADIVIGGSSIAAVGLGLVLVGGAYYVWKTWG